MKTFKWSNIDGVTVKVENKRRARKGSRSCHICREIDVQYQRENLNDFVNFTYIVTYFSGCGEFFLYQYNPEFVDYADYKTKVGPVAITKTLSAAAEMAAKHARNMGGR